tara:strand:+ start:829 stop:1035 length:207 start_codon:yes stop_codon:yes gene_type:complete
MVKYFIDVRVVGLENVYAFISMQEVQFHARDVSFEYDLLMPSDEFDTYIVRCWINPADIVNLGLEDGS